MKKPYPATKPSGVEWLGEIPEHWEMKRLRHISSVKNSNVDKKSYDDQNVVRLCNYTDVYYNEFVTDDLEFMVATASKKEIDAMSLVAGDLIITKDSEDPADIGIPSLVKEDLENVVCGYHLTILNSGNYDSSRFLHRFIESESTKHYFYLQTPGVTRFGLNQTAIKDVPISFPPESELKVISDFIDRETGRIDGLVLEKQRFVDLLKEKRQALISHVVTKGLPSTGSGQAPPMKDSGIDWIGEVPEHWVVQQLRHSLTGMEQGKSPECDGRIADLNEWGVLKSGCVNGGKLNENEQKALPSTIQPFKEYEVKKGDLLMSRASGSRELIGSIAFVENVRKKLLLSDKVFRLSVVQSVDKKFLCYAIGSRCVRGQIELAISGADGLANNIGQKSIRCFFIARPPEEEQQQIADYLDRETGRLDELMAEVGRSIELLKEERVALISAAVTGKIDVRE